MKKLVLLMAFSALANCGTTVAVREFTAYAEAFDGVVEASDTVLNEIAAEERLTRKRTIDRGSVSNKFTRDDISIFAPSADPPFVASMRFAVQSVADLNGILLAYAQGRPLDVLKKDVNALQVSALGFEKQDTGNGLSGALNGKIAVFEEALDVFAGIGSREAFRTELSKTAGKISDVLDVILDNAQVAFTALTASEFRALRGNPPNAAAIREDIATEREMLAEWLHLIELSQSALSQAVSAAGSSVDRNGRLIEAAVLSGDLRARVDRIKRLSAAN
ncbi:hypothetical protein [uncultured Tateyamaria sp.]|uniref:hypothetical protein n=1 Tax=uncultured Tateyamaria sp. TaxID=455651 RepID=UPI00262136DB|nr:hypothetical protein [uncultured Tateyamaria sp.]